jgi:hypothetical protein
MTSTIDFNQVLPKGGYRIVGGTFTNAADTGSNIVTGLTKVLACFANANATALAIGIKESTTAGTITIYGETSADTDDGVWWAIGR